MTTMKTTARLSLLVALSAFTAAAASAQTPGAAPAESQVSGKAVFTTYCASCHGESGRGDGAIAIYLRRRPADLTQIATRHKGTFPADRVHAVIDGRRVVKTHGDSQMPVWGDAFAKSATVDGERGIKAKIDALVKYVESIQERPVR